jgi:hypothetical protein
MGWTYGYGGVNRNVYRIFTDKQLRKPPLEDKTGDWRITLK